MTFDDGPTPELTKWIVSFLDKEDIKATFFCVGDNLKKLPNEMQRIQSNGHQLASHTMQHEKSSQTSWSTYKNSVEACAQEVGNNIFRPPYGRLSAWKSYVLSQKYQIVMWSWLSYDYDENVEISDILKSAEKDIKGGDILVLHDNEKVEERIKLILPELVQIIRKKGLKFRLISA